MTNCSYCGKEIFDYNDNSTWLKNKSIKHYRVGCRLKAANERACIRAKQKRQQTKVEKLPKVDKTHIIEVMPETPFLTDEQWWQGERYQRMSRIAKSRSAKIKIW